MTMLAAARLGAVHSVVFGGFASRELADAHRRRAGRRSSSGRPAASSLAGSSPTSRCSTARSRSPPTSRTHCLVLQRPPGRRRWSRTRPRVACRLDGAEPVNECVPVLATDPLYILYTSGTTGKPKGVVHDNGGYAVALTWSMRNIYGVEPGEVYWAASDLGWAVGHSYIVYGPLLARLHDRPLRRQAGRHA